MNSLTVKFSHGPPNPCNPDTLEVLYQGDAHLNCNPIITSFNSSWTHNLAEFVCCSGLLSWKKEGRPDLPIMIWSCSLLSPHPESPLTKAARAVPLQPAWDYVAMSRLDSKSGIGNDLDTSSKRISWLVRTQASPRQCGLIHQCPQGMQVSKCQAREPPAWQQMEQTVPQPLVV